MRRGLVKIVVRLVAMVVLRRLVLICVISSARVESRPLSGIKQTRYLSIASFVRE